LSPEIGQTFFLGDGKTSDDLSQSFEVPIGATRFYMGLADAGYFTGDPGAYADNDGEFIAHVIFHTIPSPSRLTLIGIGGMFFCHRRR